MQIQIDKLKQLILNVRVPFVLQSLSERLSIKDTKT